MYQSIQAFMTEFPKASLGFWGEEIFLLNQPKHNWGGVCVCGNQQGFFWLILKFETEAKNFERI